MRLFSLARRSAAVQLVVILIAAAAPGALAADPPRQQPDPWPQELVARADYADAKRLLNKQQWAEAAIVLRAVLRKNPDFLPAAMDLARALVYSGRRAEALGILSQAASRHTGARQAALASRASVVSRLFITSKTQQIYQEGLNQLLARNYRPAREQFERALADEPDNVEVLTRIGQCLVLEGDHDSAAEQLRVARRLEPFDPEVKLWLGRALHQRGELPEALAELKTAYGELDRSERAPLWYADALMSSGNRKGALGVLELDIKEQPFHLQAILALARLRIELFREGGDSLWNARKDLQVALSRLPRYASGELGRFESELGIELHAPPAELKALIDGLLAQLDARLQGLPSTQTGRSQN